MYSKDDIWRKGPKSRGFVKFPHTTYFIFIKSDIITEPTFVFTADIYKVNILGVSLENAKKKRNPRSGCITTCQTQPDMVFLKHFIYLFILTRQINGRHFCFLLNYVCQIANLPKLHVMVKWLLNESANAYLYKATPFLFVGLCYSHWNISDRWSPKNDKVKYIITCWNFPNFVNICKWPY